MIWQKNIWRVLGVRSSSSCSLTKRERYVSQSSVATSFGWDGKHLNYCIANVFKTICTNLYILFYRATACNETYGIAIAIMSVCPSVCQMRTLSALPNDVMSKIECGQLHIVLFGDVGTAHCSRTVSLRQLSTVNGIPNLLCLRCR